MNLLLALAFALAAHADEIFDLKIDILVNTCAKGVCKAERIGPLQHSIVLKEKPEGLTGRYEWFDRIDDGYYASVRVFRANGQYRVQAYAANGDEAGAFTSVNAWVNEATALNRLQISPTPSKRDGVVHDITLTLN